MSYPHPSVRNELGLWVEGKVDISEMPDVAEAFGVTAIPVAIALTPDGAVLARRLNFVEPDEFQSWLQGVRVRVSAEPQPAQ